MKCKRDPGSTRFGSRFATILIFTAALLLCVTAVSHAALDVSPGTVNAIKGQNTTVILSWRITGEAAGLWSSAAGNFENISGAPYGSPTGPLSINVSASGNGSVTETLVIPSSVVNDVVQGRSGDTTFFYRRDFSAPPIVGGLVSDSLTIRIVLSQAAGPVSLRRVELTFEKDGRRTTEVTVARNEGGLTALADLYVNGTGYLEGYWEVDGRRLENIRKYASSGSKLTVQTSTIPGIPTFRPGLHSVRLVITSPAPGFTLPRAGYIVTGGAARKLEMLRLLAPEEGTGVDSGTVFRWQPGQGSVFNITFTSDLDGDVVLTAQTRDPEYSVPAALLSDRFSPGSAYLWQVTGYDPEGELISRSRPRRIAVGRQ